MNCVILLVIAIIILTFVVGKILRARQKRRLLAYAAEFGKKLDSFPAYGAMRPSGCGIKQDLDFSFDRKIIKEKQKRAFTQHYNTVYHEAVSLSEQLYHFRLEPSRRVGQLIVEFESITAYVSAHNEQVLKDRLSAYKEFFDHCLKYPLDEQQRRSILSEEDNCLVVSSAGSGKTSSIIGKVKYLTEIKKVDPQKILLISYTNKAAAELTERMSTPGLRGYTFHKLAIDIIGQAMGKKPSICDNTDSLFVEIYHSLLHDSKFRKSVVEYFVDWQGQEDENERKKNERLEQLSEMKSVQLRAVFPDMDGKDIYVKSRQEQKICFSLSSLGVRFRYEEPYEHELSDETHSQYRPDFSIYFYKDGIQKRIYLEHFGVDEHGLVPAWFAKDKGLTYEQANRRYNDGITWKIEAHKKFGTTLLTSSSADFRYTDIKERLKTLLENAGVPIHEKTEEELYAMILPPDSKQEKAFIRLAVTFITLLKSSCKSFSEVLHSMDNNADKRSRFVAGSIFAPIYVQYERALAERKEIDFTDAILQATQVCQATHIVEYEHIIVDEFQDISVDRYNFLKALRDGNPPARLYCVGDDWQSIYRFSGSDMSLFNQFSQYFGDTEICKIETTYRFGEPLVSLSSQFIQRNGLQLRKNIHPFNVLASTQLEFHAYERSKYCDMIDRLVAQIPMDKSIFLLGRYSFDDYYLSFVYQSVKRGNKFYYIIGGREIEFLTVHKSKGLEADYVIILQCNKDTYGFPSLVSDDPVLNYVLTAADRFPFGEERRLFYVAITRAKEKTMVLYDRRFPSVFVDEFLHPGQIIEESYAKHPNANKRWTRKADQFLLQLHREGKSVRYIATKMGRSQTSIIMRLGKLKSM